MLLVCRNQICSDTIFYMAREEIGNESVLYIAISVAQPGGRL